MIGSIIKGVIILVVAMLVFSYTVNPETKYKVKDFFFNVKEGLSSIANIESSKKLTSQEVAEDLCTKRIKEDLQTSKIKSPVDFSYSILEIKRFDSMGEAENYRKKYTTFDFLDPLCEGQSVSEVIAVMFERRYDNVVEPLTGMEVDKETGVALCNEKGEYLIRGYSWECKEKIKQEEPNQDTRSDEIETKNEETEKPVVDSVQIPSKSITNDYSCRIQCTAYCDKKGYSYHSSTYEEETICKCNCASG